MMESAGLPESPMEQDDIAYLCKGCGEVCHTQPALNSATLAMRPPDSSLHANDVNPSTRFSRKGRLSNLVCPTDSDGDLPRPIY